MALAATCGAAFVIALAILALRTPPSSPAPSPPTPGAVSSTSGAGPDLAAAERIQIDLMDRRDPARRAAHLSATRVDPLAGRHYAVERPEALYFLRDGRMLHIRADRGRLYLPERHREPESGTLNGNVVVRLFEARADARPPDPHTDEPLATLTTETLTFDADLGTLHTDDAVCLIAARTEFRGTGLRLIFDQIRQRVEMLEVSRGEEIRVVPASASSSRQTISARSTTPTAAVAASPAVPGGSRATASGSSSPPAEPGAEPAPETLYRIILNDAVRIEHESRTLEGDCLTVWVRLVNHRLPPDAIAPLHPVTWRASRESEPLPWRPTGAGARVAESLPSSRPDAPEHDAPMVAQAEPAASAPQAVPLHVRWSGTCLVVPLDTAPPELARDHVAGRLTADRRGRVLIHDPETGATGHAAYLEYAATTRRLVLGGPGPGGIALSIPGTGRLEAGRLEATGFDQATVVHVPGPSVVSADDASPQRALRVACTEQADFEFRPDPSTGTAVLRQAVFQGAVRVEHPEGSVRGGHLRADFAPAPHRSVNLVRLIVRDEALAESPRHGRLAADVLDLALRPAPPGGDPEPVMLTATGRVEARQNDVALTAGWLEAPLRRDGAGQVRVLAVRARESVRMLDRSQGWQAEGDTLDADLAPHQREPERRRQFATLAGTPARLARASDTTITGEIIRLDGVDQRVEVVGAGTFHHTLDAGGEISASWQESMQADDRLGLVDCAGQVQATARTDPASVDTLNAQRLRLELARPLQADAEAAPGRTARSREKRRLARIDALGSVPGGSLPVRVESRRYGPAANPDGRRRLAELYYLEARHVSLNLDTATVHVPGAGRLLIVDHHSASAHPASPLPQAGGSALFDWKGSMTFDQAAGQATLTEAVRLTHQTADGLRVIDLTCDRLMARFREAETEPPADGRPRLQLTGATAQGRVHLHEGPPRSPATTDPPSRELSADRIEYDALARRVEAFAPPGGAVRFFDPQRRTPVAAASLLWDLASDRLEIQAPAPAIVPR